MGSGWTSYFTAQGDQGNAGGRVVGAERTRPWNGPTPSSSVQPQALLLHGRHTLYKVATLQAMGLLDTMAASIELTATPAPPLALKCAKWRTAGDRAAEQKRFLSLRKGGMTARRTSWLSRRYVSGRRRELLTWLRSSPSYRRAALRRCAPSQLALTPRVLRRHADQVSGRRRKLSELLGTLRRRNARHMSVMKRDHC